MERGGTEVGSVLSALAFPWHISIPSSPLSALTSVHYTLYIFQLVLNSVHKYQPRIHIVKTSDETQLREIQDGNSDSFSTHIFEEMQFMGVTAYQNQQVAMVEWAMLAVCLVEYNMLVPIITCS